eukprot:2745998-Karenia_brevis.AAC.1
MALGVSALALIRLAMRMAMPNASQLIFLAAPNVIPPIAPSPARGVLLPPAASDSVVVAALPCGSPFTW